MWWATRNKKLSGKRQDVWAFHLAMRSRMERGKRALRYNKENPSLAGIFLFKNSPQDCFSIHLLQSAHCVFVGRCPTPRDPFEKGSIENFSFLVKNLKFAA